MKNIFFNKYMGLAVAALLLMTNCDESIDRDNLPIPYASIGGYENSDQIASANLVAKLSFEDNLADKTNNVTSPAPVGVEYTTGIKGKAYNGSSSSEKYAVANVSSAITGLNAFTISFWMNSSNTVAP